MSDFGLSLRISAAYGISLLSNNRDPQIWRTSFVGLSGLSCAGLSGLSGRSRLCDRIDPFDQINRTDQTHQTDHFEIAPPFHLQIQIARTTKNSRHTRKRHALFGQPESQHLFPWHSRLYQLFFTRSRMFEISDQHPIKLPASDPIRRGNRAREK